MPGAEHRPDLGMSLELSGVKPAAVHLSTCLVSARPPCPYVTPGEFAEIIEK